jgi:dolichyl-diphosphooligosaccharide--protein glycosyltransferase
MEWEEDVRPGGMAEIKRTTKSQLLRFVPEGPVDTYYGFRHSYDNDTIFLTVRCAASILMLFVLFSFRGVGSQWNHFVRHADDVARQMSDPQVVFKTQVEGREIIVDDYLKGYQWIDKNTPKDSRVMAWWDYGYQITGIAKRTSIADGNTWNHEHIATLGKILTSQHKKAHNAIRHLADYVLVWAGGHGDDLAKSPHLARIGNSVFPDHCGDKDPKCEKFGFYTDYSDPTPMMKQSLLYNLVSNGEHGARVNPSLFKEVHETKYGLMKVYKVMNVSLESKAWCADPANRVCDAPGSWYCVGQYPPALNKLIEMRRSFSQLEDFNKKGEKSAYTKLIEKELSGGKHSEM